MKSKLRFNPTKALAHLRANDEALATLIDRVGPFEFVLKPADSLFEAMLRSIVYQQLHGKAAATIHGRVLVELAKHGGTTPEALTHSPRISTAAKYRNTTTAIYHPAGLCGTLSCSATDIVGAA